MMSNQRSVACRILRALNHGGDEQAIIDYVIGQGGIDNTLRGRTINIVKMRWQHYDAVRDFPWQGVP